MQALGSRTVAPSLQCPLQPKLGSRAAAVSRTQRQGRAGVRVFAEGGEYQPQLPKGVAQPKVLPTLPPPKFGWVDYAERLNSRAAMIGFFALLLVEGISGRGLLQLIGISVGGGLNIGL
ncbi:OHP1 [Auxenochlorella protothecoides x Auxenochlorella symbiontica]|uniref:Uncharacterized protein n=1 Tax=Auxenochlorella protothecoides TaxID=3075 RepID=A0A1D2A6Y0_AUXPR